MSKSLPISPAHSCDVIRAYGCLWGVLTMAITLSGLFGFVTEALVGSMNDFTDLASYKCIHSFSLSHFTRLLIKTHTLMFYLAVGSDCYFTGNNNIPYVFP